jgi:hypothetical protein
VAATAAVETVQTAIGDIQLQFGLPATAEDNIDPSTVALSAMLFTHAGK